MGENGWFTIRNIYTTNVFEPVLRSYTGKDAMQKFVEWLEDVKRIANIPEVDMIFGKKEAEQYNKETKCWICKGGLNNDKVRDHCHFTGRYRGAAHNLCNLKYRKPNFTPVVFHNLSGYDSHLFIKNLGFFLLVILTAYQIMRKDILALLKI